VTAARGHVTVLLDGPPDEGEFTGAAAGALVAELTRLGRSCGRVALGADLDLPRVLVGASVTVLVSERHDLRSIDRLDAAAHGTGRPWLSITHHHPYVQVGPYVVPFRGPCHRCLRIRLEQHGHIDPVTDATASRPGVDPVRGVGAHVGVTAAGLALAMIADGVHAGVLFQVSTHGLPIVRIPVAAAHLCPRCGAGTARAPARDNERIRRLVARSAKEPG
jgi:bacteriocin biosynthesis cyclodehydratase domain-containing protein